MLIYFHRLLLVRLFTIIHGENIVRDILENKDYVEINSVFFPAIDVVILHLILRNQAGEKSNKVSFQTNKSIRHCPYPIMKL